MENSGAKSGEREEAGALVLVRNNSYWASGWQPQSKVYCFKPHLGVEVLELGKGLDVGEGLKEGAAAMASRFLT